MGGIFYRIGYNTLVQISGKTVSTLLSFVSVALLTRYLGKEGFGNFSLVFAYLSFFGIIADFGLQLTMVRELAKKDKLPKEIYGTYFWLKVFLVFYSTALAIFGLLLFPYSKFLRIGIIIASMGAAIGIMNTYGMVIFQANLRLDLVTLVDVLTKVVTVGFIVLFVTLGKGFYSVLNTVLIGNLAGTVMIIFFLKKFTTFTFPFDFALAKKIISKSLPVGLISLLAIFYFRIDTLILSIFKGTGEVGIYSLAYRILENLLVLWGFYMATAYPLLSNLLAKERMKDFLSLWRKSAILAILSAFFIIITGYLLAPFIIGVLGGIEFKESITALRILLFGLPLFFLNNLFYHTFLLKEKVRFILLAISFSLLLNLVLNLIFIPKWGYLAAAFNTIITEVCLLSFYFLLFKRHRLIKCES